jgi:glutamate-1-semialdehyde 2,1-aminomutase
MPLAVYGGRRDILEKVSPLGPVYQAGTLSGNPLAVACGLTTLGLLSEQLYADVEARGAQLQAGLEAALKRHSVPGVVQRVGSMLTLFFNEGPVNDWDDANASNLERFAHWHAGLIGRGIYWPPSQFEAAFVSVAHTEDDVETTVAAASDALARTE